MIHPPLLRLTLALSILLSGGAISPGEEDPDPSISSDNRNLQVRGDFRNLRHRIEVDKKCHVAFLGGSITQNGGGHTAMVPSWLREQFPDTEFSVTNAGLSSTCSTSGAFRLASHVFGGDTVDLLVVEFAVNDDQDAAHARRECIRGMEGIVRQVRRDHPMCDIVMVHFVNPPILEKLLKGEVPVSLTAHEDVAKHYEITSVNVAAEIADATMEGRYGWKEYGGTHPNKFGYRIASNMINEAIKAGLERAPADARPEKHALASALDEQSYDRGSFVPLREAIISADWKSGKVGKETLPLGSIRGDYTEYDVLRANNPGAALQLEFEGRGVGVFILAGPDAGIVEVKIDGGPATEHDLYHRFSGGLNYPRSVMFAGDLEPGKHTLTLEVSDKKNPKSKGNTASLLFFEVNR